MQVGLISFLLGFFRLGFIDVVLSRALLRGFITAVAVVIMMYVFLPFAALVSSLTVLNSEQFIPMFGLTQLQHVLDPETTVDKIVFLCRYALSRMNPVTAIISFSALFSLVALRSIRNKFKGVWWIYRVPEVLVVVVVSTCMFSVLQADPSTECLCYSVLSEKLRWDLDGVDILGEVDVHTGGSFIEFPLKHSNIKFLHRTTSTAVSAFISSSLTHTAYLCFMFIA